VIVLPLASTETVVSPRSRFAGRRASSAVQPLGGEDVAADQLVDRRQHGRAGADMVGPVGFADIPPGDRAAGPMVESSRPTPSRA
jgi:creatinine amidohydrolase/Fe(II)-dependent formamide hydrolase-like protein